MDKRTIYLAIALFSFVAWIMYAQLENSRECEASGGTFAKPFLGFGYKCIK